MPGAADLDETRAGPFHLLDQDAVPPNRAGSIAFGAVPEPFSGPEEADRGEDNDGKEKTSEMEKSQGCQERFDDVKVEGGEDGATWESGRCDGSGRGGRTISDRDSWRLLGGGSDEIIRGLDAIMDMMERL